MAPSDSPIAAAVQTSLVHFSSTCDILRGRNGRAIDGVTYYKACDARDRLTIWASNIGAFQYRQSTASLDYRLRSSKSLADPITSLLIGISEALKGVHSIASGSRDNRVSSLSDYEEFLQQKTSEDAIEAESRGETTVSEIQELFDAVTDNISHLFRLSTVIRSSTTRDRYARAAAATKEAFSGQYDIAHISHKFPKLARDENEWLLRRLGEANVWRRQYFWYMREHHQKLAETGLEHGLLEDTVRPSEKTGVPTRDRAGFKNPVARETPPSQLAPTTASTLIENTTGLLQPLDESRSQASYATTINETNISSVSRIMSLQAASEHQPDFLCPYCWIIQRHSQEKSWRKHVLTDLRPYVCTYKDCGLKLFEDRHSWVQHETQSHKYKWRCNFCYQSLADSRFETYSSDDFEGHLSSRHGDKLPRALLPAIVQSSRYLPDQISPTTCPFCDEWADGLSKSNPLPLGQDLVVTPEQLAKHVGNHLVEVALFALPRSLDDASVPGSDVAVELNSRRSSLETTGGVERPFALPFIFRIRHVGIVIDPERPPFYPGPEFFWQPSEADKFVEESSSGHWIWDPRTIQTDSGFDRIRPATAQELARHQKYKSASLIWDPERHNFIVASIDCTAESESLPWRRPSFVPSEDRTSHVEFIGFHGQYQLYSVGPRDWFEQLLPITCQAQIDGQPHCMLAGDLSLLVGLLAFSTVPKLGIHAINESFRRNLESTRFVPHSLPPSPKHHKRVMVVEIGYDPTSVSAHELKAWEKGEYGEIFS
ncbi:hypothetical protein CLAIMM_08276 [Cladophialophora immunda]|nr:hypothetical protein CLAIMM_08276 [Cladophialophora immunda]